MTSSQDSKGNSATANSERRLTPRHAFVATAEITECIHTARFSGRVTEISRNGCFVDVHNTLPIGTALKVRILCDNGEFVSDARVLYIQDRIGMGIVFVDSPADQVAILEKWLKKLPPAINV